MIGRPVGLRGHFFDTNGTMNVLAQETDDAMNARHALTLFGDRGASPLQQGAEIVGQLGVQCEERGVTVGSLRQPIEDFKLLS